MWYGTMEWCSIKLAAQNFYARKVLTVFDNVVLQVSNTDMLSPSVFREGAMPAFSYAAILNAIGQVLDQIGVRSIAIQEEEDGLFVEGFNSDGQLQVQMRYDIASLYELVSRAENQVEERDAAESEGILHRFLIEHERELVGVNR